tara:strand:- start:178 stop:609 length:432 start_codon:yes stop_codon:yes gene_type:complete
MNRLTRAFYDGIITGIDPIGVFVSYATTFKHTPGNIADKYGTEQLEETLGTETLNMPLKQRTLPEQAAKGAGDVVGLTACILSSGILQLYSTLETKFHHDRRQEKGLRNRTADRVLKEAGITPGEYQRFVKDPGAYLRTSHSK